MSLRVGVELARKKVDGAMMTFWCKQHQYMFCVCWAKKIIPRDWQFIPKTKLGSWEKRSSFVVPYQSKTGRLCFLCSISVLSEVCQIYLDQANAFILDHGIFFSFMLNEGSHLIPYVAAQALIQWTHFAVTLCSSSRSNKVNIGFHQESTKGNNGMVR